MAIVAFSGIRLISRGGAVLDCEVSGLADRRAAVAWSARTASQIASISKQFVAVVTLLMHDQGLLGLDDPVTALLPEAPAHWRTATVKHLLTHTSGLPHWCERPGFEPAVVVEPAQRLAQLLDAPLDGEPGAVWRYSSLGYILLSAVLERATGRAYSELARELIIDKLGLARTAIGTPPGDEVARGYRDGDPVPPWDLSNMAGTGDVWSTAPDVAAFITALHEGTLLPSHARTVFRETSVAVSQTSRNRSPVVVARYGLGHFVGTVHGQDARLHPGDNPGYQALAAWLPAGATTVVVLNNDENDDLEAVLAQAA